MTDPILLKLDPGTASALKSADIHCLEDLLQMDPDEIPDLPGIGQKRNLEILKLLHSLPFDFKRKPSPVNPLKDGLLGVDPELKNYISRLFYYPGDQNIRRGLAYFRENRVLSIKPVNQEENGYEVYVKGSRQYRVLLSLEGRLSGQEHCTCPAFHKWSYGTSICKHIVAAALAVAEQQRLSVFEDKGDVSPDITHIMSYFLNYFLFKMLLKPCV